MKDGKILQIDSLLILTEAVGSHKYKYDGKVACILQFCDCTATNCDVSTGSASEEK